MAHRSKTLYRALIGLGVMVGTAGLTPAMAADDGYRNVFSSVLGAVGVMPTSQSPDIEYRERAPLVLPPKMNLAKPNPAAPRPASWPQDPDVLARKKADQEARAPLGAIFARSNDRVLSKDEMMKGRIASGDSVEEQTASGICSSQQNNGRCLFMSPDQLKSEGERFNASNPDKGKDEVAVGVEPERDYLTQPPKGYRVATKSVKATHEAPLARTDSSNPKTFIQEQTRTRRSDDD